MTDARAHSRLGASKAKRWLHCPGSVALCDGLPNVETPAAREGSAAHYVAEQCLRHGHDAADFVGRKLAEFPDVPCTVDMAEAVQIYLNFCRALFVDETTGKTRVTETAGAVVPVVKTWIEAPFCLLDFDSELSGHNDFAAFNPTTGALHIVDYKHGKGVVVDVEGNHQLRMYGLGALMQIPAGVSTVHLHVVQPRARGEAIKSWACDPMDLMEYGAELAEGAERTRQPDAPLAAGDWCQFCPAKTAGTCPALRELAAAVVLDEFADTKAEAELSAAALSGDALGSLLATIPQVRMWCDAIEKQGLAAALRGDEVSGFKLVESRSKRVWQDGDLAMRQAARAFVGLIEMKDLFTRDALSPAKLETLLQRAGADKKECAEFVSTQLAAPKPGYSLAPLSDKRAPVSPPTSDSDFHDVGSDDDGQEN